MKTENTLVSFRRFMAALVAGSALIFASAVNAGPKLTNDPIPPPTIDEDATGCDDGIITVVFQLAETETPGVYHEGSSNGKGAKYSVEVLIGYDTDESGFADQFNIVSYGSAADPDGSGVISIEIPVSELPNYVDQITFEEFEPLSPVLVQVKAMKSGKKSGQSEFSDPVDVELCEEEEI